MKRFIIVAGLCLTLIPAALANQITLNETAYSFADGGEFSAQTSPQSFLGAYAPSTIVNGGFETFCVEESVFFNPGVTYSYTEGSVDSQGRVLTEGAAFLYYEFAKGILTGYDYNNTFNRTIDAGELQSAIWKLQGNQSGGFPFPNGGTGNPFYDLAVSNLGANITVANNGLYSVEILQLWDDAGGTHQNQLALTSSVPDTGSSLLLLLIGLAGVCGAGARMQMLKTPALAVVRTR